MKVKDLVAKLLMLEDQEAEVTFWEGGGDEIYPINSVRYEHGEDTAVQLS